MSKPITLSKTSIEQFMSGCNYKYPLYKKYTMKKMSPAMQFGIDVHQMLEEGVPQFANEDTIDIRVYEIAQKLETMTNKLGYHILDREVKHIAPLTKDIQVFGIIDVVAELDGEPVLIDYKTAAQTWKTVTTQEGELIVPKAVGFQGPIYLTTPYAGSSSDYWGDGLWPGELHYLLAPTNGLTKVHKYYDNATDRENLLQAARQIKAAVDAGAFPKNRGWMCGQCDWKNVCYQTRDWRKYHEEK